MNFTDKMINESKVIIDTYGKEGITKETVDKSVNQYSDLLMNEVIQKVAIWYNINAYKEDQELALKEGGEENEKKVKDIDYEIEKIKEGSKKFNNNIEFLKTMIYIINQFK